MRARGYVIAAASPLEQIYNDLLIGDVETFAEKLVARSARPIPSKANSLRCLSSRHERKRQNLNHQKSLKK
jgi:hypothetical protein